MNYIKIYNELIDKCVIRAWTKQSAPCYVEKHHILPRALGGNNSKSNLVVMTAKEHFVAHHLLWKIHRNVQTYYALIAMRYDRRNNKRIKFPDIPKLRENSRLFSKKGKDHPLFGIGHRAESKLKMSKSHKGKVLSKQTRNKMSVSRRGNTCQSKGTYYTPKGNGRSLNILAELNNCSGTTIQSRCKRMPDKILSSKKFPKDWIGKTFRQLGWYYIPD